MKLRQILRDQTAESHQRLDDIVADMHVFDSKRVYQAYLHGMYQLYAIYGAATDQASRLAGISPSVSSLMEAIASDCGETKPDLDRKYSELDHSPESMNDASACWAVGYVLEGSAMGARYMVKAAEKLVKANSETDKSLSASQGSAISNIGVRYLTKLSTDSYDRWPKFIEALNSASEDCDEASAVTTAQQVFVTAGQIFEELASELAKTESSFSSLNELE